MYTYAPANTKFDSPIASLLSILCILTEILSRAHAQDAGWGGGGVGGGGEGALMISDLAHLLVVFRVTVRRAW